jgi:mannose/cellobiose epimerase-like protein (N-acyl-D-glucosamine 2-epimerase family)
VWRSISFAEGEVRQLASCEDGLFRTLVDAEGMPLDERALLYDQAFALLG